ncbi:hypothetical protein [Rhodoferax sp.]|nr:hypothetical protein [Rhodoferax sp.]MCM2295432.1 hypothetical protein [Rhodoferax sp.]
MTDASDRHTRLDHGIMTLLPEVLAAICRVEATKKVQKGMQLACTQTE